MIALHVKSKGEMDGHYIKDLITPHFCFAKKTKKKEGYWRSKSNAFMTLTHSY